MRPKVKRACLTMALGVASLVGGGVTAHLLLPARPPVTRVPLAPEPPGVVADPPAEQPKPKPEPPARVICIDPGHPSENGAGAVAADGLREVAANWQVAQALRTELVRRGTKVVMTKAKEGQKVTNRKRAEIANEAHADLCVRLHCDANSGQGHTVYYPEESGTVDGRTGPDKAVREASGHAAQAMSAALREGLGGELTDNGVKTDRETAIGRKQGALTGSIYSHVPVLTIEMVDLTHAADVRWMRSAENQRKIAAALADGALRFADGAR
ncbi:MAG: N-acetylmuramoyl-L-alanine amidase [Armatimonadetes bacterium]|nr:N-acetylmuramoyl-L-alanine amidase [Armatimonadota bacterium]